MSKSLPISIRTWQLVESLVNHGSTASSAPGSARNADANQSLIQISNQTDTELFPNNVVAISGLLHTPQSLPTDWDKIKIFIAMKPSAPEDAIAVIVSPAPPGQIGYALISGIAKVKINVASADHKYARPTVGDITRMTSCASGSARILYREKDSGDSEAVVQFPYGGGGGGGAIKYVSLRIEITKSGSQTGDGSQTYDPTTPVWPEFVAEAILYVGDKIIRVHDDDGKKGKIPLWAGPVDWQVTGGNWQWYFSNSFGVPAGRMIYTQEPQTDSVGEIMTNSSGDALYYDVPAYDSLGNHLFFYDYRRIWIKPSDYPNPVAINLEMEPPQPIKITYRTQVIIDANAVYVHDGNASGGAHDHVEVVMNTEPRTIAEFTTCKE